MIIARKHLKKERKHPIKNFLIIIQSTSTKISFDFFMGQTKFVMFVNIKGRIRGDIFVLNSKTQMSKDRKAKINSHKSF